MDNHGIPYAYFGTMAKLTGGRLAAARAFKAARGRKGVSQAALAEATGVAKGVIQNLEAGNTWPNATSQARLEPAVGMPAGELERIASAYEDHAELIDEETDLLERLTEVQRRQREDPLTQEQAEFLLKRQLVVRDFFQRRVELLRLVREMRRALDDDRAADAKGFTDEIEDMLQGNEPI